MKMQNVHGTLDEDLTLIGAKDIGLQAQLAGVILEEAAPAEAPKEEPKEQDEAADDPIDGKTVTDELLTRLEGLPEEGLTEEKIDALLAEMGEKECPDDLVERATGVVRTLLEKKFEVKKVRRGKKASKVRRQVATAGFKTVGKPKKGGKIKSGARGKVVKSAPGKLKTQHRIDKRERKTGGFKAKLKIRQRRAKRFDSVEISPFANELSEVLRESTENEVTLRQEILERAADIMDLMSEEFEQDVVAVLESAWAPLANAYNEGRLDESTTSDDEFIASLKPCLVIFAKVLDRMETMEKSADPMTALRDLA